MNDQGETSPEKKTACPRFVRWLAIGFGLGLSPVAPGTVGTLLGVAIVVLWRTVMPGIGVEIGLAILLSLAAVPICGQTERYFGKKDDGRIVADEYMTFPICMLGLPVQGWVLAVAFLTNRVCDILKPPPAYQAQRLPGGWGVVTDDVVASLMSLGLNHAIYRAVLHFM
jgi:phosphatidylglycerophosphatase A